ncbi:MAG TPA: 5-deoxy-glucuronate isomerase [Ornithinibacter sp.]|nr:5-deoxy-glucuronate isomerase [Ornithinibacter sp.]
MSLGQDNTTWCHPAGSLSDGPWDCVVDTSLEGWNHTGLRTATLRGGDVVELPLTGVEAVVVPLSGGLRVDVVGDGEVVSFQLAGRTGVFAGPTDVAYAPPGTTLRLVAPSDLGPEAASRVAVCLATTTTAGASPARHLAADEVPVELRGAGIACREVRNFGVPGVLDAQRMIACEVLTPAGNWSSWPPHKHDTERPGVEAALEEIYWFETRSTDDRGTDAVGYQRVYGTAERPIDALAEVRTGDVVLVPHGWHGPAIAAPDADLYYLNVMAGPGAERTWLICYDPAHEWVREAWEHQEPDPRLPFGTQHSRTAP